MRGRFRSSWFFFLVLFGFLFLVSGCGGGGGEESSSTSSTTPTAAVRSSTASVLALVDSSSTATRRADDSSDSVQGTATLVVDLNDDDVFDSATGDRKYETVIKNGQVSFAGVEVRESGITRAKLTINKDGCAPYEKILELSNGDTINVKVETTPVVKVTQEVPTVARDAGGYLVFGVYRTADGTQKAFVRSATRADVSLSGTEATVAIPVDALVNAGVTRVTASMQVFDGTKDRQQFPGEFVGTNYSRAGENEVALQSVSFAYLKLEDQDGKDLIQETMKRLAGDVGMTVTLNVPCNALQVITDKGDDDSTQPGVQVPLWTYNYNTGTWTWVGEGDLYGPDGQLVTDASEIDTTSCSEGDYYVKGTIEVANWGDYVNLDYPVMFTEPQTVCVTIKDQNGNPISGAYVYGSDDTYVDAYTDSSGVARLNIFSDPSNYSFGWSSQLTNYLSQDISNSDISPGTTQGCDYEVTVTYTNPYTARVKARMLDEDGNPVSDQFVEIWSTNSYEYWNSGTTDENGEVEFSVKPNVSYTIWAANQEKAVNVNGTPDNDEESDNGTLAFVEFQKQNIPPEVSVYVYPSQVTQGRKVYAYIYAWDEDGDNLTLVDESLVAGSKSDDSYSCSLNYSYAGYASWTCEIDTSKLEATNYTFSANVTDGHVETPSSAQAQFIIFADNMPPQIYAVYAEDAQGNYVTLDNLKSGEQYTFYIYAWDPDSTSLTYTATLDGQNYNGSTFTWTAPSCNEDGGCSYNLSVTVSDDNNNSDNKSYTLTVYGNRAPILYGAGILSSQPVTPGSTIKVFAYAYDADKNVDSFQWTIDDSQVSVEPESVEEDSDSDGWYYYEAQITLPESTPTSGSFEVCVTVTDQDDAASAPYCFPVFVEVPNTEPMIESALPETLSLTAGDSHTFTVSAYDPDGDTLTYTWYVNDQQVGTGDSLTYTFNSAGDYEVKCLVSDGKAQVPTICEVTVANAGDIGVVEEAFNTFVNNPTDNTYQAFISAVDSLPATSAEAHLIKALGELFKLYQDNQSFFVNDLGIESISDLDGAQGEQLLYNLLENADYDSDLKAVVADIISKLETVDTELGQAESLSQLTLTIGGDPVTFDSLDVKLLRSLVKLSKAIFYLVEAVDLDSVGTWDVTYDGESRDIRELIQDGVDIPEAVWEEFLNNNPQVLTYSDRSKLSDMKAALQDAVSYYEGVVNILNNMSAEDLLARDNNVFDLSYRADIVRANLLKDSLNSILNAIDDATASLTIWDEEWAGCKTVQVGDTWYAADLFDFYKLTLAPGDVTLYDLLNVNGGKTLRDILTSENFYDNEIKDVYETGVESVWKETITTTITQTNITVDGNSADWIDVPTFYQNNDFQVKIARDDANKFYMYVSFTNPLSLDSHFNFELYAEEGRGDSYYYVGYSMNIGYTLNSSDDAPSITASEHYDVWYYDNWDLGQSQEIEGTECQAIEDANGNVVAAECSFPDVDHLTFTGALNGYEWDFWNYTYNNWGYSWQDYGTDLKLLPETATEGIPEWGE